MQKQFQLSSIAPASDYSFYYIYENGQQDEILNRATTNYMGAVQDLIPAYEEFYANNGDTDSASMLRHFSTSIVAFNGAGNVDTAVYKYAVSDVIDLMPAIRELIHEDAKGVPQPLVLTEVKELSVPESINVVLSIEVNIAVQEKAQRGQRPQAEIDTRLAPVIAAVELAQKQAKAAVAQATAAAKGTYYRHRLANKIKQIAGQEASNAFLAGAL